MTVSWHAVQWGVQGENGLGWLGELHGRGVANSPLAHACAHAAHGHGVQRACNRPGANTRWAQHAPAPAPAPAHTCPT